MSILEKANETIKHLREENNALQAELAKIDGEKFTERDRIIQDLIDDLDHWKSVAGKYREALKNITIHYELIEPKNFSKLTAWHIAEAALRDGGN
jgi:hypothetical protein